MSVSPGLDDLSLPAACSSGPQVLLPGVRYRATCVCSDPPLGRCPHVHRGCPAFLLSPVTLSIGISSTRRVTAQVLLPIFYWFFFFLVNSGVFLYMVENMP